MLQGAGGGEKKTKYPTISYPCGCHGGSLPPNDGMRKRRDTRHNHPGLRPPTSAARKAGSTTVPAANEART